MTAPGDVGQGLATTARPPEELRTRITRRILWGLSALLVVLSMLRFDIAPERLAAAFDRAGFILDLMLPPVVEDPPYLAAAAVESVQIAIIGTVFGVLLSLLLGVLAARNITPFPPLVWLVKGFAALVRAIPALVWALLFIVAVGLGPTAGILAIAMNSIGMLAKVYAETIEEMPRGPVEALRACGAGRIQIALQGVLPSVSATLIAWSVFRFDINLRYASVLGVVGAGGLGWELVRASQQSDYDVAIGVTLVIFALVLAAEGFTRWLQRRSDAITRWTVR